MYLSSVGRFSTAAKARVLFGGELVCIECFPLGTVVNEELVARLKLPLPPQGLVEILKTKIETVHLLG